MKRHRFLMGVAAAIMLLCCWPYSHSFLVDGNSLTTTNNNTVTALESSELFSQVKDSVVEIEVEGQSPNPHIFVNESPLGEPFSASGSGFIYDGSGHIVTNYHVVENADTVSVRFLDGNIYPAKIMGKDIYSDLAVLQVDPTALHRERMRPLQLANLSDIKVGQQVAAIGSPVGMTGSLTEGIISQINRIDRDLSGRFWRGGLIQTDADINPGNSGGPLLNFNGQVVGVNDFVTIDPETGAQLPGLNFAISSKTVLDVVPQLILKGTYRHPWLGITIADLTPAMTQELGMKQATGVIVTDVSTGSPAYLVGLRGAPNSTSIILGADQNIIKEKSQLINLLNAKSPGDQVTLKILENDGKLHSLNIKLGERPPPGMNFTG